MKTNKHRLYCADTYPSGAEEWCCDTCGRRFIIQWSPEYRMIVLDAGDPYAIHNAGKGAIAVQSVDPNEEEQWLGPWKDWLNKIDF